MWNFEPVDNREWCIKNGKVITDRCTFAGDAYAGEQSGGYVLMSNPNANASKRMTFTWVSKPTKKWMYIDIVSAGTLDGTNVNWNTSIRQVRSGNTFNNGFTNSNGETLYMYVSSISTRVTVRSISNFLNYQSGTWGLECYNKNTYWIYNLYFSDETDDYEVRT